MPCQITMCLAGGPACGPGGPPAQSPGRWRRASGASGAALIHYQADIEELVDWMLTSGRRRGGKPGTGLYGRSARLTLGRLRLRWRRPSLEGKLVRNVARLVSPPEYIKRERETWSKAEVRKFLAKASADRLHAAWRLSLYGLRRGEVLGLRWSDIDLRGQDADGQPGPGAG